MFRPDGLWLQLRRPQQRERSSTNCASFRYSDHCVGSGETYYRRFATSANSVFLISIANKCRMAMLSISPGYRSSNAGWVRKLTNVRCEPYAQRRDTGFRLWAAAGDYRRGGARRHMARAGRTSSNSARGQRWPCALNRRHLRTCGRSFSRP